jgi:hypothetical protein
MRLRCLCIISGLLLAALPTLAAEKTVTLRLRHYPVADIDRMLLPESTGLPFSPGILAWTADDRRNTVTVTGSETAIQRFRELVRLIDIPKPRIRLAVRLLRIERADLRGLNLEPIAGLETLAPHAGVAGAATFLTREQVAALEARPALRTTEMTVANQQPLHLGWETGPEALPALARIIPRVNGDGSVTLSLTLSEQHPVDPRGAPAELVVLRRLPAGTAVALLPRAPDVALLVTVREARRP